jgi:hypothetical protein
MRAQWIGQSCASPRETTVRLTMIGFGDEQITSCRPGPHTRERTANSRFTLSAKEAGMCAADSKQSAPLGPDLLIFTPFEPAKWGSGTCADRVPGVERLADPPQPRVLSSAYLCSCGLHHPVPVNVWAHYP